MEGLGRASIGEVAWTFTCRGQIPCCCIRRMRGTPTLQEAQGQMTKAWQEQRARWRLTHSFTKPCLAALLVPLAHLLSAPWRGQLPPLSPVTSSLCWAHARTDAPPVLPASGRLPIAHFYAVATV